MVSQRKNDTIDAAMATFREVVRQAGRLSRRQLLAWAEDHWKLFEPVAAISRSRPPQEHALRALARHLAGLLWDHVPRPEQGYRPFGTPRRSPAGGVPGSTPGRNDPCPCGSGLKYKKCCLQTRRLLHQAVDEAWLEHVESVLPGLATEWFLEDLEPGKLEEVVARNPEALVLPAARVLEGRGRPKLVARFLEPRLDPAMPMVEGTLEAFLLLLRSFVACGWTRKATTLARNAVRHHPADEKVATVIANELMPLATAGRDTDLAPILELADLAPRSPSLRLLAAMANLHSGHLDRAQETAGEALALAKDKNLELPTDLESILEVTANDPEAAHRLFVLGTCLSASMYEKLDLLKESLRDLFLGRTEAPAGEEVIPVEGEPGAYRFARRSAVGQAIWERFDITGEMEPGDEERIAELLDLALKDPLDLGVLEALLSELEAAEEDILLLELHVWNIAHHMVPEEIREGRVRLEWGWHENRPYLRLLARKVRKHRLVGKDVALEIALILLALDPDDHQGIRGDAVHLALELSDPRRALEILRPFEEDLLPETLYGRALAHFMLGEREEADAALDRAIAHRPLVARRLLDPDLLPPELSPLGVVAGGDDEAWFYTVDWAHLWEHEPGAMEWLRERNGRRPSRIR